MRASAARSASGSTDERRSLRARPGARRRGQCRSGSERGTCHRTARRTDRLHLHDSCSTADEAIRRDRRDPSGQQLCPLEARRELASPQPQRTTSCSASTSSAGAAVSPSGCSASSEPDDPSRVSRRHVLPLHAPRLAELIVELARSEATARCISAPQTRSRSSSSHASSPERMASMKNSSARAPRHIDSDRPGRSTRHSTRALPLRCSGARCRPSQKHRSDARRLGQPAPAESRPTGAPRCARGQSCPRTRRLSAPPPPDRARSTTRQRRARTRRRSRFPPCRPRRSRGRLCPGATSGLRIAPYSKSFAGDPYSSTSASAHVERVDRARTSACGTRRHDGVSQSSGCAPGCRETSGSWPDQPRRGGPAREHGRTQRRHDRPDEQRPCQGAKNPAMPTTKSSSQRPSSSRRRARAADPAGAGEVTAAGWTIARFGGPKCSS